MSFFTSSNDTMTEQLLLVGDTASCCIDRASCSGQQESHHGDCTTTKRQDKSWSIKRSTSSSESSSTCFRYLRPRFLLVGILFGAFMELVYVQSVQHGYAKLEQAAAGNYSVRMDHWTDVFYIELSFLYSNAVFVLYIIVLARSALKKNLSLSMPVVAANWLVGMVLGLLVAVACLFGPQSLTWQKILQVLAIMIVGITLSFVSYAAAMELQKSFGGAESSSMSSCASLPRSSSSLLSCKGTEANQETRDRDANASSSTTALFEALIV